MKSVIVLGSTGSIGRNSLSIIRRHRDKFKVLGLSAFANTSLLCAQIKEFKPKFVSIFDKDKSKRLQINSCKVFTGQEGLEELASFKCDAMIMGISGVAALKPIIRSLSKAKKLLLANKEAIISAGRLLTNKMKASETQILPVDSEAWAVYNLLKCSSAQDIRSIYITASGGPMFKKNIKDQRKASISQILKHPIWNMGKRITVDSATLMNKGFEVIEVSRLFDISLDKIKVLIHPQSVIHALLERQNRSLVSSLFFADMRIPIGASLGFGQMPLYTQNLDLAKVNRLDFFKPDYKKFPLLKLAYFVAKKGKSLPAVLVASDEEAVSLFLRRKIKFFQIQKIIEKVISCHRARPLKGFNDVFLWQDWAKDKVRSLAAKYN